MSKDEYYVEPDHDGDLTLWVDDTPIVATLENGGLFVQDSHPRHERAVWRAAASVLAPDDDVVEAAAAALHDWNPLVSESWADTSHTDYGNTRREQARAVLNALRDRAVSD